MASSEYVRAGEIIRKHSDDAKIRFAIKLYQKSTGYCYTVDVKVKRQTKFVLYENQYVKCVSKTGQTTNKPLIRVSAATKELSVR